MACMATARMSAVWAQVLRRGGRSAYTLVNQTRHLLLATNAASVGRRAKKNDSYKDWENDFGNHFRLMRHLQPIIAAANFCERALLS